MTQVLGAITCAYRGYHTYIRHGCSSNTAEPVWGPAFCDTCGASEERSMPIAVCGHCQQSTSGEHESHCPLNPRRATPGLPTGWVCPKCSAANAPSVERCACSPSDPVVTKKLLFG